MEVVVVFPCVPAMAMVYLRRAISASISMRGNDGNSLGLSGHHFGILRGDRRRGHEDMRPFNILWTMPDRNAHAQLFQSIGNRSRFKIGSGNLIGRASSKLPQSQTSPTRRSR